jgi:biotin carboxyl carrier protein
MRYRYQSGSRLYDVSVERRHGHYRLTIDDKAFDVEVVDVRPGILTFRCIGAEGPGHADAGTAAPLSIPSEHAPPGLRDAEAPPSHGFVAEPGPHTVHWSSSGGVKWLSSRGCSYRLERPSPPSERSSPPAGALAAQGRRDIEDSVRAPMPALVRAVQVAEGAAVQPGQTLLLLEAMKMEIRVASPREGIVARLLVRPGQTVAHGQVLAELES